MASKKSFLLRLDPELHRALEDWAEADYRSVNAQIEYLLSELVRRRRLAESREAEGREEEEASHEPEKDWDGNASLDLSMD